jgi:hypothetical protein
MPARLATKAQALAITILSGMLAGSCGHYRPAVDGPRLDMSLAEAKSPEDIKAWVLKSLEQKYGHEDMTGSYALYNVTNGPARWLLLQAYNAPRGLNMFNLYCYEYQRSNVWLLRAYVPVNAHYLTNSLDPKLAIQTDNGYVNVVFRGSVIFTIKYNEGPLERLVH